MARSHSVWVLTSHSNRPFIEAALRERPIEHLHFRFDGLPRWLAAGRHNRLGAELYHYIWQIAAYFSARRMHRTARFHVVHHVTFGKCWTPSFLSLLPIPFVWGPVGGAESAPMSFWPGCGIRGLAFECVRGTARWFAAHGVFVRLTASRARVAVAKTDETARWLRRVGAADVRVCSEVALPATDVERMADTGGANEPNTVRFVSVGNLIHVKGFHLALRALAASGLPHAEYWIVGDGPERRRLQKLARVLRLEGRVHFLGRLPRKQALEHVGRCDILVHPSLHDSGGWATVEALAAGRPVICLDIGGPGLQITAETGIKVAARSPRQAITDLAAAMRALTADRPRRARMALAARAYARQEFTIERQHTRFDALYREVIADSGDAACISASQQTSNVIP